jgi:WD40 repeat protein
MKSFISFIVLIALTACAPPSIPTISPAEDVTQAPEPGTSTPPAGEPAGTLKLEKDRVDHGSDVNTLEQILDEIAFFANDIVRVTNGGTALLDFGDKMRMRLFNDTEMQVISAEIAADVPWDVRVFLYRGGFSGQLTEEGGQAIYETPGGAKITVLGTDYFVVYDSAAEVTIAGNFEGSVEVTGAGERIVLPAGNFVNVPDNQPPNLPQPLPLSQAEFEQRALDIESPVHVAHELGELRDRQWNELTVLRGHEDRVTSAVFSPDGQTILTASFDGTARLWDGQGSELAALRGHRHRSAVWSAIFSPDGETILTASSDWTTWLWDRQGNELAVLRGHVGSVIAVFSPNGQTILTAGTDGTARLWDRQGNELAVLRGHGDSVRSAIFSPDGETILTASDDGAARLWDRRGNELVVLRGHDATVWSAIFSPDGEAILTASDDGTARLWNRQGNELAVLRGHGDSVRSAVFSPDGQTILTASSDGTARLWDRQGNELAVLRGHDATVWSAIFSPDGEAILTASDDGAARLWDRQGNELAVLRGHERPIYSAVFSPDGQTILTASGDRTARLYRRR